MTFEPGTYKITNLKSGSALDLSGGDNRSIIGFPAHDGVNQQWEFTQLGSGWMIRSVSTGSYLTTGLGVGNGVLIVANAYPVAWTIEHDDADDDNIFRISWPTSFFDFDLEHGSETPGTKIQLWVRSPGADNQKWILDRCDQVRVDTVTVTTGHEAGATGTTTTTTVTTTTTTVTTTTERTIS